jgi:hypothetical protein
VKPSPDRARYPNIHPDIRKPAKQRRMAVTSEARGSLAYRGNTNVKLVEPPSCNSPSAIVFIGKNSRGNWIVQQQNGLYGGLFVNRTQAVKYALFENGGHPETIIELSREIELEMSKLPSVAGIRRVA